MDLEEPMKSKENSPKCRLKFNVTLAVERPGQDELSTSYSYHADCANTAINCDAEFLDRIKLHNVDFGLDLLRKDGTSAQAHGKIAPRFSISPSRKKATYRQKASRYMAKTKDRILCGCRWFAWTLAVVGLVGTTGTAVSLWTLGTLFSPVCSDQAREIFLPVPN